MVWTTIDREKNFERNESQLISSGLLGVGLIIFILILPFNLIPYPIFYVYGSPFIALIYSIVTYSIIIICFSIFVINASAYIKLSKKSSVEEVISKYKNRVRFIAFHKSFTLAALGDLKSEEAIPFIEDILLTEKGSYFKKRAIFSLVKIGTKKSAISLVKAKDDEYTHIKQLVKSALDYLAKKYDFYDHNKLYRELKQEIEFSKDQHKDILPEIDTTTLEILELEKIPKGAKCMVSKLIIDPRKFEIVACPHCHGLARKILLEDWLNENGICPKCKKLLNLDECYLAKFSQK